MTTKRSISSPAVFHANRFLLPAGKEAKQMTVTSGLQCLRSLRGSPRVGFFAKMFLASSTWHSTKRLLTWKASVIKRKHFLFRLVALTPITDVTGYGLLPTPVASDDTFFVSRPLSWTGRQLCFRSKAGNLGAVRLGEFCNHFLGRWINAGESELLMGYPPNWTKVESAA